MIEIARLFTNDRQQSAVDVIRVETGPERSELFRGSGVFFKEFPAGTSLDWHPAPRRMIVIILSGQIEHGFADGQVVRFGPGDVRLVEDTSGQGHTTRVPGDEPAVVAVVPLDPA